MAGRNNSTQSTTASTSEELPHPHNTRSSTGTLSVMSTFMKKVTTSPQEGTKPKLTLAVLQDQINAQNAIIDTQTVTINSLIEKVNSHSIGIEKLQKETESYKKENELLKSQLKKTDFEVKQNTSLIAIKDRVAEIMKEELHRLQQYTRRYSVAVVGIEKRRGEKRDHLTKEVEKLVNAVDSSTTMDDVDKFHRNGPAKGNEQEVIIRFKSHSAKEAFYRARKTMNDETDIKIRPSLSPNQKALLYKLQQQLHEYEDLSGISNPPEYVFANIHGEIQVKFKEESKKGSMFVTLNSVKDLALAITNAQHEDIDHLIHVDYAAYDSSSDDDMGFGQFS